MTHFVLLKSYCHFLSTYNTYFLHVLHGILRYIVLVFLAYSLILHVYSHTLFSLESEFSLNIIKEYCYLEYYT